MTYPAESEVRRTLDRILVLRPNDLDSLKRQVRKAFDFGRAAEHDGYPSSTMGGGRGGGELTSVEAAVNARVFGRSKDHDDLTELYASLVEWAGNQDRVYARLRLLAARRGEDVTTDQRWCEAHGLVGMQVGGPDVKITLSTVGGRLDNPAHLCPACYDVVRRYLLRLPTLAEMRHYVETGTWRITGADQAKVAG